MIRTNIGSGVEAVSFWYGDSLVTEFYDSENRLFHYQEETPGLLVDKVEQVEALQGWHQAQIDIYKEGLTDVSEDDGPA